MYESFLLKTLMHSFQEAEKHLTGMEKWCGLCVMPWYKRKKIKVRNITSYPAKISYDFPSNALRLNSKLQDVDDSKWETSKDGTVVKKQPGDAQKITLFNVAEKSKFQVCFSRSKWWEWSREWRTLYWENHQRRQGGWDGGEHASGERNVGNSPANLTNFFPGRLCAIQLERNVSSHGRRDRKAEQAAGQD